VQGAESQQRGMPGQHDTIASASAAAAAAALNQMSG